MKIFLDAGHNYSGLGTGANGFGLREEVVSFAISNRLRTLLEEAGHTVKMSREHLEDNVGKTSRESINLRAKMANEWGADLFVSIHCNAGGGKGVETLVYSKLGGAAEMANRVQDALVKNLDLVSRGVKERPDLGVLRLTKCDAFLVETAFIDDENDAWLLKTAPEKFADAIFEGMTGEKPKQTEELTEIHDIVWEYAHRGLVTDSSGMEEEMRKNPSGRLYWLARKTLQYLRERNA